MSSRPTLTQAKAKALKNKQVKEAYDALSATYEMKRQMIGMRKAAGLTQEQMAEMLGTKKSNISRLESIDTENSPRIATVEEYARVLGYALTIEFEPRLSAKG